MMTRFLAALQFLTLLPVPLRRAVSLSDSVLFFPLVGALLGVLSAGILLLSRAHLGTPIAALLSLASLLLLTGGLHEDGLADVADAFRAGRSPDAILRILKDSRIGTYGALALIATLLLRWQALCLLPNAVLPGVAASLALSRTALVALAAIAPPSGEGMGASFIRRLNPRLAAATVLIGLAISLLAMHLVGLLLALATTAVVLAARSYFLKRLGGVNGDCLGATCQLAETVNLLILAWQPAWQPSI